MRLLGAVAKAFGVKLATQKCGFMVYVERHSIEELLGAKCQPEKLAASKVWSLLVRKYGVRRLAELVAAVAAIRGFELPQAGAPDYQAWQALEAVVSRNRGQGRFEVATGFAGAEAAIQWLVQKWDPHWYAQVKPTRIGFTVTVCSKRTGSQIAEARRNGRQISRRASRAANSSDETQKNGRSKSKKQNLHPDVESVLKAFENSTDSVFRMIVENPEEGFQKALLKVRNRVPQLRGLLVGTDTALNGDVTVIIRRPVKVAA